MKRPDSFPTLSEVSFLHEALFGYPPDRFSQIDFLMSLPSMRNVALAMVNSPRYRVESRAEVPLWQSDKWVMADLHGLNIWINLHDRFIATTILDGHYEDDLMAHMFARLPPGGTLVDAGANIGAYTLQAARQVGPGGKVFAFEPQEMTFRHLARSASANGFDDRCVLINEGLSDTPARASMIHHPGNPGASNVTLDSTGNGPKIVLSTLDERDFGDRVDFFKIDVEGFETNVLKGGKAFFARYRPSAISEVFPAMLREHGNSTAEEYIELWQSYGYRVSLIGHPGSGRDLDAAELRHEENFPPLFNIALEPR
ncbi:MAG: FkbM family methyltransferase [Janthinobacterium lividum]